ncbi:MAG TPA: ABC transporter permease [Solirubrobacteraceae bacterium]|nr:ABC transporter permease [Solirubrobacteraceae bacterium]
MSARLAVWEVARRELVERSRSRTMRVSFVILLLAVVGGAIAAARIADATPVDHFALVGPRAEALAPLLERQARASGREAEFQRLDDAATAARAVRDGDIDVAIANERLIVERSDSGAAVRVAQQAVTAHATLERLEALGLTQEQAVEALAAAPLPVQVLEPEGRDADRNRDVLFAGMVGLFWALIGFGTAVASSVTEEKSSRVVELLLTTVSPRRLLAGKVLGVGLLGLAEVTVIGAAALVAGHLAGGAGLPSGAPGAVALVAGWFVLGFAFYSVAFAAVGAMVSRQEDLGSAIAPISLLMTGAYFASLAAIENPNGTWAQIATLLPPFAPMVVPARVVLGDMSALAVLASIGLQITATVLLVIISARVYERAILRIGAPVSLHAVLRGTTAHEPVRERELRTLLNWAAALTLVATILLELPFAAGAIIAALLLTVARRHGRRSPPRPTA